MNENLNLSKILRDCPKGTKLYSTIYGDVELVGVYLDDDAYPIGIKKPNHISTHYLTKDGRLYCDYDGECTLFPSREQRDWSKFEYKNPKPKFDHKTLKLMDKVLVRNSDDNKWRCALYSYTIDGNEVNKYVTIDCSYNYHRYCIPYNKDTQHLTGTTDEAPEFYKY